MWHDTKDVWLAGHDGDDRYRVTLQHIGSEENPRQYHALEARASTMLHKARVRARRDLAADGEPLTDAALMYAVARDPILDQEFSPLVKEFIVLGTVGGESTYRALFWLGGPDLLTAAQTAVREFHRLDDSTKKD